MTAYERLLDLAGDHVRQRGTTQSELLCPAHEDRTPSLTLSIGRDENAVVHCHAGCPAADVMATWPGGSLPVAALFDTYWNRTGEPDATYDYVDETGELLFQVVRKPGKQFRQRRPDGAGGWIWKLGDTRRVLYRLPRALEAVRAGRTIYIPEGEKDVHALEAAGVAATCNPGGVGKWRTEYSQALAGADVVVIQDKDDAGRRHAQQVVASLLQANATARIVEAVKGKDAFDHLRAGHTVDEFIAIEDAEPEAADRVPPKLRLLDTRHLVTTAPPAIDWLADGVFAEGKFTLVGGREKSGKSLVQLAIAIAMASGGGTVTGIPVAAGKVLVCDGENGEEEIHRRIHSLGLEVDHADQLVLTEARGFDLREDLRAVEDLIDEHQPDLVLLDSFRALWRGSERDEEEIATALYPLAEVAHRRRVAIGLTHHATKGDSGDYRGSTAIGAVPDWICVLARDREDTDQMRRRLTTPYARFAPPRPDRWLRICSEGDDGPVWLETCDAFVPERETPVRDAAEAAIRDVIRFAPLRHPLNGDGAMAQPWWTRTELLREAGLDPRGGTAQRAFAQIADTGLIYRNGDGKHWHRAEALFDDEEAS